MVLDVIYLSRYLVQEIAQPLIGRGIPLSALTKDTRKLSSLISTLSLERQARKRRMPSF